jgi:hypothetical protein
LHAEDIFYAAALAILLAWLVLSAGTIAPLPDRAPVDSPLPEMALSETAVPPAARPRVIAEVTVDSERFYILVGDGPPNFGVAVSGP